MARKRILLSNYKAAEYNFSKFVFNYGEWNASWKLGKEHTRVTRRNLANRLSDPACLCRASEATLGILHPVLDSPVHIVCEETGQSNGGGQRPGAHVL